jgi:hypothetical protein
MRRDVSGSTIEVALIEALKNSPTESAALNAPTAALLLDQFADELLQHDFDKLHLYVDNVSDSDLIAELVVNCFICNWSSVSPRRICSLAVTAATPNEHYVAIWHLGPIFRQHCQITRRSSRPTSSAGDKLLRRDGSLQILLSCRR